MDMGKTGFVGLGRMGQGMALNMCKSVDGLMVFDAIDRAMEPLINTGAIAAANVADLAARCDLIFLCLPSKSEVQQVIHGDQGIMGANRQGLVIIDTTTLDRADAVAFASDMEKAGVTYADCPISGMPIRAADGTLTTMFGGDAVLFNRIKPLLESFAEFIVHCGPVGSGQAMKAINNIIYDINIVALCEVLPLALASGLNADALARVTTTASSRSFASDYFVPRMLARQFDKDFAMGDAYKDILNIQKMAMDTKAMTPLINAMTASYQNAMAAGYADQPKSAILKIYEQALAVEFCQDQGAGEKEK